MNNQILDEQIRYYRARAGEYDDWFFRRGRYDLGEEHTRQWLTEIEGLRKWLNELSVQGRVLELAAGTGLWTEQLAPTANRVTAVDASTEVLQINRGRTVGRQVDYVVADLFEWAPTEEFDFVFFSFWLSHVPEDKFDSFWKMLGKALKSNGKIIFLDFLFTLDSTAKDHALEAGKTTTTRRLNDGREFEIVKVFYDPKSLQIDLRTLAGRSKLNQPKPSFYVDLGRAEPNLEGTWPIGALERSPK